MSFLHSLRHKALPHLISSQGERWSGKAREEKKKKAFVTHTSLFLRGNLHRDIEEIS